MENYLIDLGEKKRLDGSNSSKITTPQVIGLISSLTLHLTVFSFLIYMDYYSKIPRGDYRSQQKNAQVGLIKQESLGKRMVDLDSKIKTLEKYGEDVPEDEYKLDMGGWGNNLEQFAYRISPLEELIELGAKLFYFESGYHFMDLSSIKNINQATNVGEPFKETGEKRFTVYIVNPSQIPGLEDIINQGTGVKPERIPLEMDDLSMGREILKIINKPDDEKVNFFITEYLEKYDLNVGDLPKFTRKMRGWVLCEPEMEFARQNVPYLEIERSLSFLEERYHWKLTEKQLLPIIRKHPESSVSAEFYIDFAFSYVREKKALMQLRDSYEIALKILNGKLSGRDYEFMKQKAFVIKEVYESVERAIEKNGFKSLDEVFELYDKKSEKIFAKLIQMGGKYRNEALYWIAKSHLISKNFTKFVETWKMIDGASGFPSSYEAKAYADITEAISRGDKDLWLYEVLFNRYSPYSEDPGLVRAIERNTLENGLWSRRSKDILARREQGIKLKFDWYIK